MGIFGGHESKIRVVDFSLRLLVVPLSAAASIWITVTTKQNNSDYGTLEFSNLTALEYMVCVSAISAGYAVLTALSSRQKWLLKKPWILFVADQIIAYLMVTSMAAQGEFLYLAYNGDEAVTWSEGCPSYGKLCRRVVVGLSLHGIGVCCFLLLAVFSAYTVFNRFQPPLLSDHNKEEQEMT
ncbi:CASP-like protein 2D1 [Andrographis paniculata]|uniref:CASP-like protein 2D1 n=1 Tax=Andrographis paniculata TaxID=175694 RepID=UPI0021E86446|nr:CASP-like protein 2D1 [Andrographis paniculata]